MREEQLEWNIALCGLNCARCPIYQAHHSQDNEFQHRCSRGICGSVVKYPPNTIKCDGCRGDPELHWTPECTFKPCAS